MRRTGTASRAHGRSDRVAYQGLHWTTKDHLKAYKPRDITPYALKLNRGGCRLRIAPGAPSRHFEPMLRPVDDDPDNPRWLRRPKPQPPLLKVPTHWAVRLSWIVAQGGAIVGGMYLSLWSDVAYQGPRTPQVYCYGFLLWVLVVAFVSGIISALWGLATRTVRNVARSRARPGVAQEPDQETLRVSGATRLQEDTQIVGRGGSIQQHPREVGPAPVHPHPR